MSASIRQVCVLSVSIRQLLDRHVYCLSVSDSFWMTGMCLVCWNHTSAGQICVLSVRIRQLLDRYVYCLSVSDSFWTTGMCTVCKNQTVSGHICVLSVSIRPFLDRYLCCLSVPVCLDRYVYCLSISYRYAYLRGIQNTCMILTVSIRQVCVLAVSI